MNIEILRKMVAISNNSQITNDAVLAMDKLPEDEQRKVIRWLELAEREQTSRINTGKRKF